MKATDIIELLQLEPLPEEGGYFRQNYYAPESLSAETLPTRYTQDRPLGTAIYALFTADDFSAMHRLDTDEIYHFYIGDPLELLLLNPNGTGEIFLLGNDLNAGMRPQKVVSRGVWQGSRPVPAGEHGFTLIGTTMAPGFEWVGFELGNAAELIQQFPQFIDQIKARTR